MRKSARHGDSGDRRTRSQAEPGKSVPASGSEPLGQFKAILASKLNPPQPQPAQLLRTSVRDLINKGEYARLTLVRAPAGFGKTTAMLQSRQQLQQNGIRTSWLTLDQADNDVARFLMFFVAAFERLSEEPGRSTAQAPRSIFETTRSLSELMLELINRIRAFETPFALYLDDVDNIQNPAVFDLINEVLRHLPVHGRLVMASRQLPDLALGRLRAMGLLSEVEVEQLTFSQEETRQFLCVQRGLKLDDVDVVRLHERTEGWPAALWLASAALEKRLRPSDFVAEFSGSSTAIADYLTEDVLAHLDPSTRDFLLRTSILGTLNAPACNALLGINDSMARLEQLERMHLFLVPIGGMPIDSVPVKDKADRDVRSYRYHRLFAQYLRSQLERRHASELPALHHAAAEWYHCQNRPVPTIEHALESGDNAFAVAVLNEHADRLLAEGRVRLLARWLDRLPEDILQAQPRLRAIHLWAIAFTRGPKEAMTIVESLQRLPRLDPELSRHLVALEPSLLIMMDGIEEAYALGVQNQDLLKPEHGFPYAMLTNTMAHVAFMNSHYDEARIWLDRAYVVRDERSGSFSQAYSETVEGEIDLLQGRLRQAISRFRQAAQSRSHGVHFTDTNRNVMVLVPLASVLYETDACEEALLLLQATLPLVRDVRLADQLICAHILLARLVNARGDSVRGLQLLLELEQIGHASGLPRALASARIERARQAILRGDYDAADIELQRASGMGFSHHMNRFSTLANDVDTLSIGRLRWMLHTGSAKMVVPLLRQELSVAERGHRMRRALKLRILLALALQAAGDTRHAIELMAVVVDFMASEGYIRILADEGGHAGALLGEYLASARLGKTLDKAYLASLKQACGIGESTSAELRSNPAVNALIDPLTTTELKVLQLLSEGHTNQVMAQRLFVSETTVRTHLRNIYVKLDAHNRTQAVAIGRRLGLMQ